MPFLLNSIALIIGAVVALNALRGDTWDKEKKRPTPVGWYSLVFILISLPVSFVILWLSNIQASADSLADTIFKKNLEQRLMDNISTVECISEGLDGAGKKLEVISSNINVTLDSLGSVNTGLGQIPTKIYFNKATGELRRQLSRDDSIKLWLVMKGIQDDFQKRFKVLDDTMKDNLTALNTRMGTIQSTMLTPLEFRNKLDTTFRPIKDQLQLVKNETGNIKERMVTKSQLNNRLDSMYRVFSNKIEDSRRATVTEVRNAINSSKADVTGRIMSTDSTKRDNN